MNNSLTSANSFLGGSQTNDLKIISSLEAALLYATTGYCPSTGYGEGVLNWHQERFLCLSLRCRYRCLHLRGVKCGFSE